MTSDEDVPELCEPFSESPESLQILDHAVRTMVEIDYAIPADIDLSIVEVSINAQKLSDICELLLALAEVYEGVDFSDQFEFHEAEVMIPIKHKSMTVH